MLGQNAAMGLKLFRSTGYSSILMPGETRLAMHPAWLALSVSLWVGFVCNVAMWRGLSGSASLAHGLAVALAVTAISLLILSVFGWRRTLKPAAILVLLFAALTSSSIWSEAWPFDATLLERPASSLLLPPWQSFLRLQVWLTLAGLALAPAVWVSQTTVRRLGGPEQLRTNILGAVIAIALLAGSAWLMERGL